MQLDLWTFTVSGDGKSRLDVGVPVIYIVYFTWIVKQAKSILMPLHGRDISLFSTFSMVEETTMHRVLKTLSLYALAKYQIYVTEVKDESIIDLHFYPFASSYIIFRCPTSR